MIKKSIITFVVITFISCSLFALDCNINLCDASGEANWTELIGDPADTSCARTAVCTSVNTSLNTLGSDFTAEFNQSFPHEQAVLYTFLCNKGWTGETETLNLLTTLKNAKEGADKVGEKSGLDPQGAYQGRYDALYSAAYSYLLIREGQPVFTDFNEAEAFSSDYTSAIVTSDTICGGSTTIDATMDEHNNTFGRAYADAHCSDIAPLICDNFDQTTKDYLYDGTALSAGAPDIFIDFTGFALNAKFTEDETLISNYTSQLVFVKKTLLEIILNYLSDNKDMVRKALELTFTLGNFDALINLTQNAMTSWKKYDIDGNFSQFYTTIKEHTYQLIKNQDDLISVVKVDGIFKVFITQNNSGWQEAGSITPYDQSLIGNISTVVGNKVYLLDKETGRMGSINNVFNNPSFYIINSGASIMPNIIQPQLHSVNNTLYLTGFEGDYFQIYRYIYSPETPDIFTKVAEIEAAKKAYNFAIYDKTIYIIDGYVIDDDGNPKSYVIDDDGNPMSYVIDDDGNPMSYVIDDDGNPRSYVIDDDGNPKSIPFEMVPDSTKTLLGVPADHYVTGVTYDTQSSSFGAIASDVKIPGGSYALKFENNLLTMTETIFLTENGYPSYTLNTATAETSKTYISARPQNPYCLKEKNWSVEGGLLIDGTCQSFTNPYSDFIQINHYLDVFSVSGISNILFVGGIDGVYSFDVSDPTNLVGLDMEEVWGPAYDLEILGDTLFAAVENGISVIQINDPLLLDVTDTLRYHDYTYGATTAIEIYNNHIYAADRYGVKKFQLVNNRLVPGDSGIEVLSHFDQIDDMKIHNDKIYFVTESELIRYDIATNTFENFIDISAAYCYFPDNPKLHVTENEVYFGCNTGVYKTTDTYFNAITGDAIQLRPNHTYQGITYMPDVDGIWVNQ